MRFFPNTSPEESIDLALEKLGDVSQAEKDKFRENAWVIHEINEKKRRGEKLGTRDGRSQKSPLDDAGSFGQLRSINLKMAPELLWKIDNAARDQGMDRSNWIRLYVQRHYWHPRSHISPERSQLRITA